MCKTPTECSRESAQRSKEVWSTIKNTGGLWLISRKLSIEMVDNRLYQGHLSIYFWKCTKKFRASPSAFHKFPHSSHYLNFKQFEWTRKKKHLRWNPSLEGNSSKKLLPISTIEITPQYAIVLSTYSWNPLVFLWGERDYLAGNTALMWRRGREKIKHFNGSGFLSPEFRWCAQCP